MATFNLTEDELDESFHSINWHGYSTLVPPPKEWNLVKSNWDAIKPELAKIDLYNYAPFEPLRVFAPKNQTNVRVITLLHPQDILFYTALISILRETIESNRIAKQKRRVFSYRVSMRSGVLYERKDAFQAYCEELLKKAEFKKNKFVAIADISDFYPRIYQHRLQNILDAIASSDRERCSIQVLFSKFLPKFSEGASYGIPVGPLASRLLGEATLIDVDDFLHTQEFDFVRWVDDFSFFCRSESEAQTLLYTFGKWLFEKHGLTLSTAKTRIMPSQQFYGLIKNKSDRYVDHAASELIKRFVDVDVLYGDDASDEDDDDSDPDFSDIDPDELMEVLNDAIKEKSSINYELVEVLLTRFARIKTIPDVIKKAVLGVVMTNLEHLYPIADSVSRYIQSVPDSALLRKKRVADLLLRPAERATNLEAYEFYLMWILDIFASADGWPVESKVARIYSRTNNEVIKRYCELALYKSGKRSFALEVKRQFGSASPIRRLSLLLLSGNLADDERKHWRRGLNLSNIVDKTIFNSAR